MQTGAKRAYAPAVPHPPVGGVVHRGWAAAAATLPAHRCVLAIEGPVIAPWDDVARHLGDALQAGGRSVSITTASTAMVPWAEVLTRTSSAVLKDDPNFESLPTLGLPALFDREPALGAEADVRVVLGPGASLARHDLLWYSDLPKRYAEEAVTEGAGRNLGQGPGDGPATTKRLFYVDWPLLDTHREAVAARVALWLDLRTPDAPTHLAEQTLTATLQHLARRPFRTRTWFNSTSWGGHWAQRTLGMQPDARNTALGYELIAPESGILVGDDEANVEVPLQLLVSRHPTEVLGGRVHRTFGTSFPIRFDYLDTHGGGNLSVHCHPRPEYMQQVFGWPYTQHETYYVMSNSPGSRVFLGLHENVDFDEFEARAHQAEDHGAGFDIERYVQTFPADRHQLFLVPAGTPHGSSAGNVVLEISATPYLYSLRFYDWLRTDARGAPRPVHVDHAFSNIDRDRSGAAVRRDLVPEPRTLRHGQDWQDELLGGLPDMFFEVRRLRLDGPTPVSTSTEDGFHVVNVVEGAGVTIEPANGPPQHLAYAETAVIPAAVGNYAVRRVGDDVTRIIRSVIRGD